MIIFYIKILFPCVICLFWLCVYLQQVVVLNSLSQSTTQKFYSCNFSIPIFIFLLSLELLFPLNHSNIQTSNLYKFISNLRKCKLLYGYLYVIVYFYKLKMLKSNFIFKKNQSFTGKRILKQFLLHFLLHFFLSKFIFKNWKLIFLFYWIY